MSADEVERLKVSLQWLESHHKRLAIERASLAERLERASAELDRLGGEIARAKGRLLELRRASGHAVDE